MHTFRGGNYRHDIEVATSHVPDAGQGCHIIEDGEGTLEEVQQERGEGPIELEQVSPARESDEETYFKQVKPYEQRKEQEGGRLEYHVYANARDEYPENAQAALEYYKLFLREYGAARLAVELYEDEETSEPLEEATLLAFGPYPI